MSKFIDKIEGEKIAAVEQNSQEIGVQTLQEAQRIIEEAKLNVIHLLPKAQVNAGANRVVLIRSMTDMLVYLRNEMSNTMHKFIIDQIDETVALKIISQIFDTILMYRLNSKQAEPDIHIVLNKNDFEKLESEILAKLQLQVKQSIKFQFSDSTGRGFMVSLDNQKLSFDFSKISLDEYLKKSLSEDWQI